MGSTTRWFHIGKYTFKIEPADMTKDADVYSSFDQFLDEVKALPVPSEEGVSPEDVPDLKRRIAALEVAMADVPADPPASQAHRDDVEPTECATV